MGLHPKAEQRMKDVIKALLKGIPLKEGWQDYTEVSEELWRPVVNIVEKEFSQWLSGWEGVFAIDPLIERQLQDIPKQKSELTGPLTDFLSDDQLNGIVDNAIHYFKNLPRTYDVYFELSLGVGAGVREIALSDSLALVQVLDESVLPSFQEGKYAEPGGLLAAGGRTQGLAKDRVYLRVQIKGHAAPFGYAGAIGEAFSVLRQFLHLGLLYKVLASRGKITTFSSALGIPAPKLKAHIFDQDADPLHPYIEIDIPHATAEYIRTLSLDEDLRFEAAKRKQGLQLLAAPVTEADLEHVTPNEVADILKRQMKSAAKLFAADMGTPGVSVIRAAVDWAFESNINDNETFAVIQACIGLEAILGEEAGHGSLTKTLGDRCAYLLGKSFKKRSTIRKNFTELYKVRSKLVHGRRAVLRGSDKWALNYSRILLNAAIRKELMLLK